MSFESARRILDAYKQDNANRIKMGMEAAYQEALTAYQSESAARDAALKILEIEQKSFDKYVSNLQKARRDFLRGEQTSVRKQLEQSTKTDQKNKDIELRNLRGQQKVEERRARQQVSDARRREGIRAREQQFAAATPGVRFADPQEQAQYEQELQQYEAGQEAQLQNDAENHAQKIMLAHDLINSGDVARNINDLSQVIRDPRMTDYDAKTQSARLAQALDQIIAESSRQEQGYATQYNRSESLAIRKADLAHRIETQLRRAAGTDNASNQKVDTVLGFLYAVDPVDKTNTSGVLQDVANINPDIVASAYQDEVNAYIGVRPDKPERPRTERDRVLRRERFIPSAPIGDYIPTPLLEKPEIQEVDTGYTSRLRDAAAPVFNALRDDYQIDSQEAKFLRESAPAALEAYRQLQEEVIRNPLAVTEEEQLLLDQLALKRQFDLMSRKRDIGKMQPQMQSYEGIQRRAADIIEPSQAKQQAALSPMEQKYFAVERKALDLSEKDDNTLRDMGAPEKFGMLMYEKMFDPSTKTYRDGKTYENVLTEMEKNFENDGEGQLRALAAFNSRAMALSRASAPLVLKDGKKNTDWLEALKALGK